MALRPDLLSHRENWLQIKPGETGNEAPLAGSRGPMRGEVALKLFGASGYDRSQDTPRHV